MKHKHLLIVILLCFLSPWAARAQLVLFSEDFNTPVPGSQFLPTGWYNEGGTIAWQATEFNPRPYEGSYCVFASQNSVKLVCQLPAFPSGITSAQLRFKHIHPVRSNYNVDALTVYCRTTSYGGWSWIGYFQVNNYTDFADWTQAEISLPVNATEIAFEVSNSFNGGGVGIDDLVIVCTDCPCPVPTNLTATSTGLVGLTTDAISATLNWTGYADNYNVRYRTAGSDSWTETTVSTNSLGLHNLPLGTTFEWQVKGVCNSDDESEWSALSSFTTTPPCTTPSDISAHDITPTSAVVSWQGTTAAYNLKYRRIPVSTTATVTLTAGDVWGEVGDVSGYQMLLDANATAYGSIIPETGGLTSYGDASAEVYSQFEYKIPENADGWLFTQNVVFNNSVSITIPAGTYDWCITNPTPYDRIWIASENGNVGGRQDNYLFEGGKIYEFNVTLGDNGFDRVDVDITTFAPSSGTVTDDEPWTLVENVTMPYTFDGLDNETMYEVEVQAVCDNGETTSWCRSIFTTLSVCAEPRELSATNISADAATLSWTGYQEGYTLRYRTTEIPEEIIFEDFESGNLDGWELIDADNDGENWRLLEDQSHSHSGSIALFSYSYYNYISYDPNNWIITPQLPLEGTMKVWLRNYSNIYLDKFAIYLSTTGNEVEDFTTILIDPTTAPAEYVEYTADLSNYHGQFGYIAIRHFDSYDRVALLVDDFGIYRDHSVPAGEWQTVTVTGNTFDINGLTAATCYEWQVQGTNCDGNGGTTEWSESAFFTTLPPTVNVLADQWYAIAAPAHNIGVNTLDVTNVTGLLDEDYDLFRYNEAAGTWENQKSSDGTAEGFTTFDSGRGYIYRRTTDATLTVTGIPNSGDYSYTLTSSCLDNDLKGFNLIGNPYPHAVYKGVAFPATDLTTGYYSLEPNGTWLAHQDSDPIGTGQGVLVQMSGDGQTVLTFTEGSSAPTEGAKATDDKGLQFTLTGPGCTDVAYALFARGEGLCKVSHLNTEAPALSIPKEGINYAIATLDGTTEAFPLKLYATPGEYTISVNATNAVPSITYCHLIDRLTGRDIDLLRQPAYTFTSHGPMNVTGDTLGDRFLVRLRPATVGDIFAYQNGNNIVFNGNGELQVFDITGRQLSALRLDGTLTADRAALGITHSGVYLLRLLGNHIKIQKIVVK